MLAVNRNWWIAGTVAFSLGLGIGVVTDRQWQKALGLGAIALSGAAAITALTPDRSRSQSEPWDPRLRETISPEYANWLPSDRRPPTINPPLSSDLASALRVEVDRLERELEQSLTRKQQLEAVIGVLRKEKEAIQSQIDEGSGRTQKVYRVLADLETQRQQLEDKIVQHQTQLANLDSRKASMERDLTQVDRLRAETIALEQEAQERQANLSNLRQREQTLLNNCTSLEAQAAELSERTATLTRSLADTMREQQSVEMTLQQQQATLEQIRTQADAHHRRRYELRQQIETLQQQCDGLPAAVAKLQAEHDRLAALCRDRQVELNQIHENMAQARAQQQAIQAELQRDRQALLRVNHKKQQETNSLRLWLSFLLKDLSANEPPAPKHRRAPRKPNV